MTSDAVPTPDPDPRAGSTPNKPSPGKRALRTRAGYTWVSLVVAAIIGIIVLIFILQNLDQVHVSLFFWSFSLPLGVTVLLSVIAGALVMGLVGGWRILQLRRVARRA
ncbi:LapA family protein [Nocardia alni]|uniref:LapA family protein n=1 Tax=Nocardia alni TaxID=2815723 RepID=UPI001C2229F0|nr:lipopolysaccharide assembly protein LapA domain-containing protein [Nocardia alni]